MRLLLNLKFVLRYRKILSLIENSVVNASIATEGKLYRGIICLIGSLLIKF